MPLNLRICLCIVVLVCAISTQVGVLAAPSQPADRPDLQLFLTALGKDDSPPVLDASALSLLIDKTPAQVKAVRAAKDDPLLFAVLVDVSLSDAPRAGAIKEAALQIFQRLASPENQGYLVLFDDVVAASPNPISVSRAKEVLQAANFQQRGTAMYDAIEQTCRQKLSRSGNPAKPRRVIVLISDGGDNASHATSAMAKEAALEEGVSVFSLIIEDPFAPTHRGEESLKEISQGTGGLSTDKDLKKAVSVSLMAIDAQSMVTFTPAQAGDNKLHEIKIKCTQKGVHVYPPSDVFF